MTTVENFAWSLDSTKIAFIADADTDVVDEVYVVDVTAPNPARVKVSAGGPDSDADDPLIWTPDSSKLIYVNDETSNDVFEYYIVDVSVANPSPSRLGSTFTNLTGDVLTSAGDFGLSPDGTRFFYIADAVTEGVDQVFVADVGNPGTSRLVSRDVSVSTLDVFLGTWTPDSRNVVFIGDQDVDSDNEIYLGDATGAPGASVVKLNDTLVAAADVSTTVEDLVVDPQNRGVYYESDENTDTFQELFFVSFTSPGSPTAVTSNFGPSSDLNSFVVSRDGSLVVYNGDPTGVTNELFAVTVTGPDATLGTPVRVNGSLVTGGNVSSLVSESSVDYAIVGDGEGVVYNADEIVDNDVDAFYTPITAGTPGTSVRLNGPLPANGDVNVISAPVSP